MKKINLYFMLIIIVVCASTSWASEIDFSIWTNDLTITVDGNYLRVQPEASASVYGISSYPDEMVSRDGHN